MFGFITAAIKFVPLVFSAVHAVEKFAQDKKGKDKQDMAVAIVQDFLPVVESGLGRDIVDDQKVQDAVRKLIDAIVAVMNVIADVSAKKQAA